MAKALYEELPERDAAFLEAYFRAHPAAREELDVMRRFVAAMPASRPVFDTDLVTEVRVRVEEEGRAPGRRPWLRPRVVAVSFAAMAAMLSIVLLNVWDTGVPDDGAVARPCTETSAVSPLVMTVAGVKELVTEGNYADAYKRLSRAIEHAAKPRKRAKPRCLWRYRVRALIGMSRPYSDYEPCRRVPSDVAGKSRLRADRRDLLPRRGWCSSGRCRIWMLRVKQLDPWARWHG